MRRELDLPWAPMSLEHNKFKIDEIRKKDLTMVFAVFSNNDEFVGIAAFRTEWNTGFPQSTLA
jgi:hypothetical protein